MPSPDVFGLHCAKGRDVNAQREQFKHAEGSRQKHAKKLERGNESKKRDRSNFFRFAHLDLALLQQDVRDRQRSNAGR